MAVVKTVLAVAYGGGHIACLLPVIARLRARGDVRVEVLALTTAAEVCDRQGVACRRFSEFTSIQDARSQAHGVRLAGLTPPHPAVSIDDTVAYLGASYRDLEDAVGPAVAAASFSAGGRQVFLPVASLAGILAEVRPDVLLTTSAPRAERAAVVAASRMGIPAVIVVDLFGTAETEWLRDPAFGTTVCVLTEAVRTRLIAAGRPAVHVRVTGNPVFDRLGDPQVPRRAAALRSARGWGAETKVITWASQPETADPQLPRRIEGALLAALADHPAWHLVLRPHPSDRYQLPPCSAQVSHSGRADDLPALLAASDVLVTMTSTVGLEAVLVGTPMVTWDLSQNTHECPYSAMGLSRGVTTLSDLAPAIFETLQRKKAIGHGIDGHVHGQALGPALGQAAARVADEVLDQLGLAKPTT